ncbi:hypothetical protein MUN74_01330 [Agromyces endophyticus]|uniref:hypothetical protein n=1 Tax=Agromyces sp. H17E-10 TaxID=2932244 RepID=UPI001FCFA975|nr:hypothetical protein [Agromyces sp. H17E-10]UOQ89589.1 hypothetical protein MUN74_01330 [Agromyces sp. H17E-10]
MPAPRRKPLLAWEPLPYLVVVVLLIATTVIRPESPAWLFWPFTIALVAAVAWVVAGLVPRRRTNPDQWGDLAALDGLVVVDAPHADREVRAIAPVNDARRHQAAIELARLHGGADQAAVLVPRANRWLTRRYRIGVQLVGGDRPRHAGFLSDAVDAHWRDRLDALAQTRRYARVPARITGSGRPFGVELDLSGLEGALTDAGVTNGEVAGED